MNLVDQFIIVCTACIVGVIACDDQFDFMVIQLMEQVDGCFNSLSANDSCNLIEEEIIIFKTQMFCQLLVLLS